MPSTSADTAEPEHHEPSLMNCNIYPEQKFQRPYKRKHLKSSASYAA
jgi:hypothetical protein